MPIETLLVEDHPLVLRTLKDMMENRGFRVCTANSAADALRVLGKAVFDLVLTDMRMETSTAGFEVIRAAKAQPNPPLVMILTAFPMTRATWRESGADGLIMKGADIGHALQQLKRKLQLRRSA